MAAADYGTGGKAAGAGGKAAASAGGDSACMKKFRMTYARSTLFGIVAVGGYMGFLFRREDVRFRLGQNCDEIRVEGKSLLVLERGQTIAAAEFRPLAVHDSGEQDFRWDRMLTPRGRRGS